MTSDVQGPQLSEEIWTNIGQHMTLKEWAQAAGTCPAAWGAQCMWSINIMEDLSVAGMLLCHDRSNTAMHRRLQGVKMCTRDRSNTAMHRRLQGVEMCTRARKRQQKTPSLC